MRAFTVVLSLVCLFWTAAAQATEAQALIWMGATSQQEAEPLRSTWEVAAPVLESAGVRPAEGYPKLLESRKVAGLKPGFWVWVVGFCAAEESRQVLSQLKEVYPGAYARAVQVPEEQLACPTREGPALSSESLRMKVPQGVVRVVSLVQSSAPEGEEPGEVYTRRRYYFLLTGAQGQLLASESAVGQEDYSSDPRAAPSSFRCSLESLRREGSHLVLTRRCRAAFSECGGLTSATEVSTLSVSEAGLQVSEAREDEQYMECGE